MKKSYILKYTTHRTGDKVFTELVEAESAKRIKYLLWAKMGESVKIVDIYNAD